MLIPMSLKAAFDRIPYRMLIPMSLKAAFDRIPEGHRDYAAVILQRAMSISPIVTETIPSLDEAFNMLGRATIRRDLLKDLQNWLNYSMGFDYILRKIEGVHDLIECCEKEIGITNKMVRAILQKEVPHVFRDSSKGMDVPVEQQPK